MSSRNKESAVKRWDRISAMLHSEALELSDIDNSIVDGLRGLASLTLPPEIEQMHKGGRAFGVVDVFVTLGTLQEIAQPTFVQTGVITKSAQDFTNGIEDSNAPRYVTSEQLLPVSKN